MVGWWNFGIFIVSFNFLMEEPVLTKKERKILAKQQRAIERARAEFQGKILKWVIGLLIIGLLALGVWWFWRESTKTLPGVSVADMGREHVSDISGITYNSNPPTSGPHYEEWTRAGVYEEELPDGNLIHSLEHGYVIISYNCPEGPHCDELIKKLPELANKKRLWKLIVVPRPRLDSQIALTAWGRIDKFNEYDEARIVAFIDAFRDKGPEKTME